MEHLRNVLGSLGLKGSTKATTMNKPKEINHRKVLMIGYLLIIVGMTLAGPIAAIAQTTGTAPTFNATVQGESASTVEGTFANVVNYVGNVICPIGAGLMVAATAVQVKSGKSWVPTGVTAMLLLGVSGITRLIESMVTNGQSAVK